MGNLRLVSTKIAPEQQDTMTLSASTASTVISPASQRWGRHVNEAECSVLLILWNQFCEPSKALALCSCAPWRSVRPCSASWVVSSIVRSSTQQGWCGHTLGNAWARMLQEKLCLKELRGISCSGGGRIKQEKEDCVHFHAATLLQIMFFSL